MLSATFCGWSDAAKSDSAVTLATAHRRTATAIGHSFQDVDALTVRPTASSSAFLGCLFVDDGSDFGE